MNFFRSEEHLRRWEGYREKLAGGVISPHELMRLFSGPYFTRRRDPDYFSRMGVYLVDMIGSLDSLGSAGPFWRPNLVDKIGVTLARKLGLI